MSIVSEDDMNVVNQIVQGDKIEFIDLEGDVEELLSSVEEVNNWNDVLDEKLPDLKEPLI
ncbi:MAG: hypothetical protein U5K71_06685 [Gracilimonas sp.]|nr:hypothetical protein [Gracilimonas sp.]